MDKFIYEIEVNKRYEDVLDEIAEKLEKAKFGVILRLNFQDKLKEKGVAYDGNFTILEVCNPYKAKEALEKDVKVGYFLPCKIAVYEEGDKVKVGFMDPEYILKDFENEGLNEIAKYVKETIISIINNLK
ncbi:DUF302 domain-containing protein [Caloramator sp. Dgby_cultured_2]|uniref:DUF302 domain-containing protein n=1 Tax=Caloramator sp. Dgby_cultured_2 TaxID=3029174 RepID=UPI00237D3CFA|nr:DUF302 domain-containing protein [Caloramator sp. Dgby_cultured_2]WDU83432.1 DUF302 domain-containing protein [Caloramator sp. Dgby_cultured_2]